MHVTLEAHIADLNIFERSLKQTKKPHERIVRLEGATFFFSFQIIRPKQTETHVLFLPKPTLDGAGDIEPSIFAILISWGTWEQSSQWSDDEKPKKGTAAVFPFLWCQHTFSSYLYFSSLFHVTHDLLNISDYVFPFQIWYRLIRFEPTTCAGVLSDVSLIYQRWCSGPKTYFGVAVSCINFLKRFSFWLKHFWVKPFEEFCLVTWYMNFPDLILRT